MTDSTPLALQHFESAAENKNRLADLIRFYAILKKLETKIGGIRILSGCSGRMNWPSRGVYFFVEQDVAVGVNLLSMPIPRQAAQEIRHGPPPPCRIVLCVRRTEAIAQVICHQLTQINAVTVGNSANTLDGVASGIEPIKLAAHRDHPSYSGYCDDFCTALSCICD